MSFIIKTALIIGRFFDWSDIYKSIAAVGFCSYFCNEVLTIVFLQTILLIDFEKRFGWVRVVLIFSVSRFKASVSANTEAFFYALKLL